VVVRAFPNRLDARGGVCSQVDAACEAYALTISVRKCPNRIELNRRLVRLESSWKA
jgi:hypothetical protein